MGNGAGGNELGWALRALRERRGMSLREAADASGVDHAYIQRIESGAKRAPSRSTLDRILRGLQASGHEASGVIILARHAVVIAWEYGSLPTPEAGPQGGEHG